MNGVQQSAQHAALGRASAEHQGDLTDCGWLVRKSLIQAQVGVGNSDWFLDYEGVWDYGVISEINERHLN